MFFFRFHVQFVIQTESNILIIAVDLTR